jgi:hypothetical protein
LNKGLELATGDIIGILHSDDYFASDDTISRIVKSFQKKEIKKLMEYTVISYMFIRIIMKKFADIGKAAGLNMKN